ncbi:MAG: PIN domain-containing protein [Trueperaceae bacterium]|nr:PIN domain-containing protein [Trueperaceae bacterium]
MDALISFIQRQNISIYRVNKELVIKALLLCRPSGRISISDALIWATALSSSPEQATIYTFDRRFPAEGVVLKNEKLT